VVSADGEALSPQLSQKVLQSDLASGDHEVIEGSELTCELAHPIPCLVCLATIFVSDSLKPESPGARSTCPDRCGGKRTFWHGSIQSDGGENYSAGLDCYIED
jgi:hypothetical protein